MDNISRISHALNWLKANQERLNSTSLERERSNNSARCRRYIEARAGRDPSFRKMLSMRQKFTSCLFRKWATSEPKRERDTAQRLFGCSWQQMRDHLQSQFQPGMTWDNHGKGRDQWSVDHIRPICLFAWWTDRGLKAAFRFDNTQPLWNWQHRAKTDLERVLTRQEASPHVPLSDLSGQALL